MWSGARDQESTNHSGHFVEWKSSYITTSFIHLSATYFTYNTDIITTEIFGCLAYLY